MGDFEMLSSQKSRETGGRIKARETHPVDGVVHPNQSCRVGVSTRPYSSSLRFIE
jgi:hypothetical protein